MELPGVVSAFSTIRNVEEALNELRKRLQYSKAFENALISIQTHIAAAQQVLKEQDTHLLDSAENRTTIEVLADNILKSTEELRKNYLDSSFPPTKKREEEHIPFSRPWGRLLRLLRFNRINPVLYQMEKDSAQLKGELDKVALSVNSGKKLQSLPQPLTTGDTGSTWKVSCSSPPGDAVSVAVDISRPSNFKIDIVFESSSDMFVPSAFTLQNPDHVVLNFESSDTLEGTLKSKVLEYGDSIVVAVSGSRGMGFDGMGGVGKTVAMTGLATERDIKARFIDGIYFMSFGQEATMEKAITEISNIVEESGGIQYAQKVSSARSVGEAARIAATWFFGKVCLFLCDDLWRTESSTGYLEELTTLVRCNPMSRMVITTRDPIIANRADSAVHFGARDPTGLVSKAIFLEHSAIQDAPDDAEFQYFLKQLLELCGGIPILLAVVATRLAEDCSSDGINARLRNVVQELGTESSRLEERMDPAIDKYSRSLLAAVTSSVRFLDKKLKLLRDNVESRYTVEQMFHSLSILSNQGWVPISVLNRLWKTDAAVYVMHFNRLRIVSRQRRSWKTHRKHRNQVYEEDGITLHDLTLDICRSEARSHPVFSDTGYPVSWHSILLDSYCGFEGEQVSSAKGATGSTFLNVDEQHRAWWSEYVPEDGYIHSNLSRHLVAAGKEKELWSLLLNPQWSRVWIEFGTFHPLRRDLALLAEAIYRMPDASSQDRSNFAELKLIYKALRCAWGRIEKLPREYPYQVLGRLSDARASMRVVNFFLRQVEETAERPWLRPLHQCLEDPREGPEIEVYFNTACSCIAYFPSGDEVAAGVDNEVHVIDLIGGDVLKRFTGHSQPVRKVAVSADGTWLASADDVDIRVWAKRAGVQVGGSIACDNSMQPKDGSFVIRDDAQIFAIIRRKLMAWNVSSGREIACNLDRFTNFIGFSADGQELVCASTQTKTVHVRNMDNISLIVETMPYPPDCGYMSCLAVSQDGKSIVCGTRAGDIIFWDRSCREIEAKELSGHEGAVLALEITKNAKLLFSGSNNGDVRMWDLENRSLLGMLIGSHTNMVTSLAASPDCTRLASVSGDHTMRVWDVMQGTWEKAARRRWKGHSGPVTCISSSPDGRFAVSGSSDREVRVWDAETGELIGEPLTGHPFEVIEVAVSNDSSIIYSWSGLIDICWKFETRQPCSFEDYYFNAIEDRSKNGQPLALKQTQNNIWECHYEPYSDDMKYVVAQMPTQEKPLKWHIDQDRQVVYIGRQDGSILILKVEP